MKSYIQFHVFIVAMMAAVLSLGGCGDDGANGVTGPAGPIGPTGAGGSNGCNTGGGDFRITSFHGKDFNESSGEFDPCADNPKYFAALDITSATAAVDGTLTVNFTVDDKDGYPDISITSVSANVAKLMPATATESYNHWVPYIYRTQTVSGSATGDWPNPDGTTAYQANSESSGTGASNGTLTNHGDGSYTYVFRTNLANVTTPVAVSYDRNRTHRVSIMMGGHSGPTANEAFDFVPNGAAITETRNIVTTEACKACHGDEFHGHGGNRLVVENCVTCHNPSTTDPHGGETVDLKVMIHKIHAGGELGSIKQAVAAATLADPAVTNVWQMLDADRADFYAIWGYGNTRHTWWKVGFPAVIENCTKCHQETGGATLVDVDNWKDVPSRAACGSCHDDIDFTETSMASASYHPGGPLATDDGCNNCHAPETDIGLIPSITNAHDWGTKNPQNIAEFDVDLTVSTPANSQYFVAGERPVVTIALTDIGDPANPGDDVLIDHLAYDVTTNPDGMRTGSAVGCNINSAIPPACTTTLDNAFSSSGLYVHGPRARRVPVLSTGARVELLALNQATYNLTGVSTLDITFDSGKAIYTTTSGLSAIRSAYVSVNLLTGTGCTYSNVAAATPTEIRSCLNANTAFAARGIAYLDEAAATLGRLAIRSRNLGDFYSLQLTANTANTAIFNNTTLQVMGGSSVSATLAANTDPKIARFADRIEYTLDAVDDLQSGTYMVGVEIGDRGRLSDTNYVTPSVKKARFQVKQATEEKAIANGCDSCHQGPEGTGFVLDFARHNKIFDHTAVDQCGQCHDYQSASASGDAGTSDGWNGSRPINRRVHAIHAGSILNYPLLTVNYSNGDPIPGRNWDITLPQDIRNNCEVCHSETETSGTWKTNASRSPCSGCHDADAATAHIKLMTYDPTPTNPWSGDEEESCQVCH